MKILELLIGLGMTMAGLIRFTNPAVKNGEIGSLPFMNPTLANLLALFETLGLYFIVFTTDKIRNIYLVIYCIAILGVSAYYLPSHTLEDFTELVTFKNDLRVIFYHILICTLMIVLIVGR
jgi:hypothetical protein